MKDVLNLLKLCKEIILFVNLEVHATLSHIFAMEYVFLVNYTFSAFYIFSQTKHFKIEIEWTFSSGISFTISTLRIGEFLKVNQMN